MEDVEYKNRVSKIQNDSESKVRNANMVLARAGIKDATQVYDYIKEIYKNVGTHANNLSNAEQTVTKANMKKPDRELTGNTETAQKNKSRSPEKNKEIQETDKKAFTPIKRPKDDEVVELLEEVGVPIEKNKNQVSYIERSIRKYNVNSEDLFVTEKLHAERQKEAEIEKKRLRTDSDS